jgi:hypothetical protein
MLCYITTHDTDRLLTPKNLLMMFVSRKRQSNEYPAATYLQELSQFATSRTRDEKWINLQFHTE